MASIKKFWNNINRRKTLSDDIHETPLSRCLNAFDITLLGIGHMIGSGIYVISGTVVKDLAGPGTVLSFLFAGIAAILAALCYAEFGARVPKAGSAYSYTYITIGEIWGFVVGWNIILEHLIGAASVARAWSGSMDSLFNGAIRNGTITYIGRLSENNMWISEYPDFVAFGATVVVFVIVAIGAKFSLHFNSTFTIINLVVIAFIICAGFYFADVTNWTNPATGGFLPYGLSGVFSGAASCFYAYIGFEGIAIASEEAKNPARVIPIATFVSMSTVTVLYILIIMALTLMIPYTDVDPTAAYPMAFAARGATWLQYVVAAGTLFGITTSLLGSAYSLPRAVYAMAVDGLLFQFLGYVHPKTQTPVFGIFVFGLIAAVCAFIFEIETLVEFMSIGTLFAYTIVAASIIILRYLPVSKCQFQLKPEIEEEQTITESDKAEMMKKSKSHDDFGKLKNTFKNLPLLKLVEPGDAVTYAVVLMGMCMLCLSAIVAYGMEYLRNMSWWIILFTIVFIVGIIFFYLVIIAHEQNQAFLTFQIPFVPLVPAISMMLNVLLMMMLNALTWIRLGVWMAAGLLVYFLYGMRYSHENRPMSAYNRVITYSGDANLSESTMDRLDEEIHQQQPPPQGAFKGE